MSSSLQVSVLRVLRSSSHRIRWRFKALRVTGLNGNETNEFWSHWGGGQHVRNDDVVKIKTSLTIFVSQVSIFRPITIDQYAYDALHRANSRFAPSQWETTLLCNDVSHWLGTSLKSALNTTHRGLVKIDILLKTFPDAISPLEIFEYNFVCFCDSKCWYVNMVKVMVCYRTCDEPLPEPMMILSHISVIRGQWIPSSLLYKTRQISTLKDSRTVLRLSLPNHLKPDVKSRMKM